jgi:hypothetical protein
MTAFCQPPLASSHQVRAHPQHRLRLTSDHTAEYKITVEDFRPSPPSMSDRHSDDPPSTSPSPPPQSTYPPSTPPNPPPQSEPWSSKLKSVFSGAQPWQNPSLSLPGYHQHMNKGHEYQELLRSTEGDDTTWQTVPPALRSTGKHSRSSRLATVVSPAKPFSPHGPPNLPQFHSMSHQPM